MHNISENSVYPVGFAKTTLSALLRSHIRSLSTYGAVAGLSPVLLSKLSHRFPSKDFALGMLRTW